MAKNWQTPTVVMDVFGDRDLLDQISDLEILTEPARDRKDLLSKDRDAVAFGRIAVSSGSLARHLQHLGPVDFYVCRLEDGLDWTFQVFGIDGDRRIAIYLECSIRGDYTVSPTRYNLVVRDIVALAKSPPIRAECRYTLEDELRRHFRDSINTLTRDPFVDEDDLDDQAFQLAPGMTEDTYARMCELAIVAGQKTEIAKGFVFVASGTVERPAGLTYSDPADPLSTTGKKLLQAVLDICKPYGWRHEYNDGDRYRKSGWSREPDALEIKLTDTSALARARALEELMPFLERHLPVDHPLRAELLVRRT